jgi:hypothetical protein
LRAVGVYFSAGDLEYFRRAAASPGTIESLTAINYGVDVRDVLPAVRVPTLLVHAAEDPTWPISGARFMAEKIPGARLVEVPGKTIVGEEGLQQRWAPSRASCTKYGVRAAGRSPSRTVSSQRCFSPTSSVPASERRRSATEPGASCSPHMTRQCAGS